MRYFSKARKCAAIILILCLAACSPQIVYQSNWQSTPVVADGVANEWKIPLRFYDPQTKLNYTISNDNDNLYVCIRATDVQSQVKIMRTGIQIWIDTTGRNKKQVGILFPLPGSSANDDYKNKKHNSQGKSSDDEGQPSASMHKAFLAQATEMQLTGFKAPMGGMTPLVNNDGIRLGMNWDTSDILIFEAIIPFKTFCTVNSAIAKTISLGIFLNAAEGESGAGNHGGGGGHGSEGSEGMGGGGMYGGGGGGGMHGGGGRGGYGESVDKTGLYQTQSFWVNFHLASK